MARKTGESKHEQHVEAGRANGTHKIYAFAARGDDALAAPQRSIYLELRDKFKNEPGRREYRENLACHLAMMLELGFSDLRERAERGEPIWDTPPVARMGTYVNALIRLLDGWPQEDSTKTTIIDVLKAVRGGDSGNGE